MKLQNNPTQGCGILLPGKNHNGNFAEIIPVISGVIGNQKAGITRAKALHNVRGVKRVFSSWFNSRVERYRFTYGTDFDQPTPKRVEITRAGRPEIDYVISLDMAKELALCFRPELRIFHHYRRQRTRKPFIASRRSSGVCCTYSCRGRHHA